MRENDYLLFLECDEKEWGAYKGKREMSFQLFSNITGHLCRLELYGLLMSFMKKYPSYSETLAIGSQTEENAVIFDSPSESFYEPKNLFMN